MDSGPRVCLLTGVCKFLSEQNDMQIQTENTKLDTSVNIELKLSAQCQISGVEILIHWLFMNPVSS
jgi:hypothetical protein